MFNEVNNNYPVRSKTLNDYRYQESEAVEIELHTKSFDNSKNRNHI